MKPVAVIEPAPAFGHTDIFISYVPFAGAAKVKFPLFGSDLKLLPVSGGVTVVPPAAGKICNIDWKNPSPLSPAILAGVKFSFSCLAASAAACAVETGLFASLVLSTSGRSTSAFVIQPLIQGFTMP